MEHFQARGEFPCSQCGETRHVTDLSYSDGGSAAMLGHEKREGLCPPCERQLPEEQEMPQAQAKPKRQFYRCGRCHKPVHLATKADHEAGHKQRDREWHRVRNHPITQAHKSERLGTGGAQA